MRRYIEIISIALISSYITLAILYLINDQIFQDIFPRESIQVQISQNSDEDLLKSLNDLNKQVEELNFEMNLIETSLKEIQTQQPLNLDLSNGNPSEVPEDYLEKFDQIFFQLNTQYTCLESFLNFYIEQSTKHSRKKLELDVQRNRGYVDIQPLIRDNLYPVTKELLEEQFNC
jgi:hypothetical protein